jgi:ketosteroid isomerase-like protein
MLMRALAAAVLLIAVPAWAAEPPPALRAELLRLEADWNRAVAEKDAAALDRILAPEFQLIWVDGSVSHKADLLAGVRARRATIDPFTTEEVRVQVYGDTAVVTGRFTQTVRLGERSETGAYRYTDVYVRGPDGWRAVAAHATRLR